MGIKISELTSGSSVNGDDQYPAVQGSSTKKFSPSQMASYILNTFSSLSLGGVARTVKAAIDAIATTVASHTTLLGNSSMGTTATTVTGAIAEHETDITTLNSKTTYLLLAATSASTTISANTSAVVNFSFSVPTGYRIVAAWDDSYLANVVACPIRINQGSGTVTVTFNYYAIAAMTRAFGAKALALMME